jgi:hypothetical protein
MKKTLIASAAVTFGAIGLVAAGDAAAQLPQHPGNSMQEQMRGTYGFWPAPVPANSNHVGIFIARRVPGQDPKLYYCSSPADATSKDPAACKQMENFPK